MSECWDDTVVKGATWNRTITWADGSNNPVDLTGGSVHYTIKQGANVLIDQSLTGNSTGTFVITLSATQTAALPAAVVQHDIWVTLGTVVTHLVCGRLAVNDC